MKYSFESMIAALLQDNASDIGAYFSCYNQPLDKSIKIITSKINVDAFAAYANEYGWTLRQPTLTPDKDSRYISRETEKEGLGKHWLHTAGFFYIQEVAAGLPARYIPCTGGDIVLDMCAAPGGKSIQLADAGAFVVSNEISGSRIIPLQYNINRTGMRRSCITSIQGGNWGNILPNFFDHVLVDAPCSGEGTGFKSDDGFKWWQQDNVQKIARLQKEILASAIKSCKPGGSIIYSTCTINPRENEEVVAFALENFNEYISLENVAIPGKSPGVTTWDGRNVLSEEQAQKVGRFWPHIQHTGGFFIAKFVKNSATPERNSINKSKPSQLDMSTGLQYKVCSILADDFGIKINPKEHFFVSSQKKVFLSHPSYKTIHDRLYIEKTGIPIFKINNNGERSPLHSLGQCLGHLATKNIIHLSHEDTQKYSEGFDISLPINAGEITTKNKYCIIKTDNFGLSVGKIVDMYIKNKFIK